jgi:hypothetical protein
MRKIILALLFSSLTACAVVDPTSHPALELEINSHVKNGMLKSEVTTVFASLGFSCMEEGTSLRPNDKRIIECTRNRGGFLYSCIHRVWFNFDPSNGQISGLQVFKPSCASM